jgi:chromosome segregation ATPase
MAPRTPDQILAELQELVANQEITILKLSEPISAEIAHLQGQSQRTSDISNSSLDATTPASLEGDLTHYRELFAKLRFSYVEQVTKEKFIRAIVGDPPLIVSPQENVDLEKQNSEAKAMLKALKTEVADMVIELEGRAKDLSKKYERIQTETIKLQELPDKISELESVVAQLRKTQAPGFDSNPELNQPLAKTLALVEAKKRQRDELDRQLEQLQSQVPRKKKELERLRAELQPLETKRQSNMAAAKEARRRKEAALGGVEDDLEDRGRWYRAAEAGLKQMLEIEG